jgi:hypothetical protein
VREAGRRQEGGDGGGWEAGGRREGGRREAGGRQEGGRRAAGGRQEGRREEGGLAADFFTARDILASLNYKSMVFEKIRAGYFFILLPLPSSLLQRPTSSHDSLPPPPSSQLFPRFPVHYTLAVDKSETMLEVDKGLTDHTNDSRWEITTDAVAHLVDQISEKTGGTEYGMWGRDRGEGGT